MRKWTTLLGFLILLVISGTGHLSSAAPSKPGTKKPPPAPKAISLKDVKALYLKQCASCHGEQGDGKGPAAADLTPKPAPFTDKVAMKKKSDEDLAKTIREGRADTSMQPWGKKLTEDQIRGLVTYIRSFAK